MLSKKLLAGLVPLLAIVAFAIVPALAQGAVWEHCVKGTGTEEFKTHKCNEKAAGGGWIWEVIPKQVKEQIKTHGVLTLHALNAEIQCQVRDQGRIWNGEQTGIGEDEVTAFVNENCVAKPAASCPTPEIIAENLPWPTQLTEVLGVIRDVIHSIKITLKCSGSAVDAFTGSLEPKIVNGNPTVAEFDAESGKLSDGKGNSATVTGKDAIEQAEGWAVRVHK